MLLVAWGLAPVSARAHSYSLGEIAIGHIWAPPPEPGANGLAVYGAIGVPEIWRHDGERLTILIRTADGDYEPAPRSAALPMLPIVEVERVICRLEKVDYTTLMHEFVTWVRENLGD